MAMGSYKASVERGRRVDCGIGVGVLVIRKGEEEEADVGGFPDYRVAEVVGGDGAMARNSMRNVLVPFGTALVRIETPLSFLPSFLPYQFNVAPSLTSTLE